MRFNSIPMACQQCGAISHIKPSHVVKGAGKFCSRTCMSAFKAEQNTCICGQCGTSFQIPPGRIQKGYGKFCSRVCADLGRTKEAVERTCEQCGLSFTVAPFRVAQGSGRFCSKTCGGLARRGTPSPLRKPDNRACEICGKEFRAKAGQIATGIRRYCSVACKSEADTAPGLIPDDERDLIYLAAFIDGEGTITANYRKGSTGKLAVHGRIIIPNTDAPVMEWIRETFGGSLSAPRATRSAIHKPVTMWYLGAQPAATLCRRLLPYLKIKRRQAEIIIALSKLAYTTGGRPGRYVSDEVRAARQPLIEEIRALNHRGLIPDNV